MRSLSLSHIIPNLSEFQGKPVCICILYFNPVIVRFELVKELHRWFYSVSMKQLIDLLSIRKRLTYCKVHRLHQPDYRCQLEDVPDYLGKEFLMSNKEINLQIVDN